MSHDGRVYFGFDPHYCPRCSVHRSYQLPKVDGKQKLFDSEIAKRFCQSLGHDKGATTTSIVAGCYGTAVVTYNVYARIYSVHVV